MIRSEDFEVFWKAYPRKVGKLAAESAYQKARKRGVTQEELLAGIERYIQNKPSYADFCHARTWLAQGRWLDEYDGAPPRMRFDWRDECEAEGHEPPCPHRPAHEVVMARKTPA